MSALHNKIDQVDKEESTLQEEVSQSLPSPRNKKQKWLSKVGRLRSRLPVTKQVAMDSNSVSTRSSSPGVVADVSDGSVQEASVQEESIMGASIQESQDDDCGTTESSVLGESTQADGSGYSTSYSERTDTQSIETKSTSEERNGWNNWWGLA